MPNQYRDLNPTQIALEYQKAYEQHQIATSMMDSTHAILSLYERRMTDAEELIGVSRATEIREASGFKAVGPLSVEYDPDMVITNLDALPPGLGARFLVVIKGEGDALVAKNWLRKLPEWLEPGEILIRF